MGLALGLLIYTPCPRERYLFPAIDANVLFSSKPITLKNASLLRNHHTGLSDLATSWPFHVETARGGRSSCLGR